VPRNFQPRVKSLKLSPGLIRSNPKNNLEVITLNPFYENSFESILNTKSQPSANEKIAPKIIGINTSKEIEEPKHIVPEPTLKSSKKGLKIGHSQNNSKEFLKKKKDIPKSDEKLESTGLPSRLSNHSLKVKETVKQDRLSRKVSNNVSGLSVQRSVRSQSQAQSPGFKKISLDQTNHSTTSTRKKSKSRKREKFTIIDDGKKLDYQND